MNLTRKEHRQLEKYCKSFCTRKLNWNAERREFCRENTMCSQCAHMLCVKRNCLALGRPFINRFREGTRQAIIYQCIKDPSTPVTKVVAGKKKR